MALSLMEDAECRGRDTRRKRLLRSCGRLKPLTGRKVLLMLVAFFGVVIGVNLVMMTLAIQTLPSTEVDSAYSASLAYEKEIATAREQTARNWKVDAHVERSGQGGATLQVEARDNAGRR
jgi:nitrogen fixation protein FixH